MNNTPPKWTNEDLIRDAAISAADFRSERLSASDAWETHYRQAHKKFEELFEKLRDLNPNAIDSLLLADAYGMGMGEAIRYLAGPPISDDDLKIMAHPAFAWVAG